MQPNLLGRCQQIFSGDIMRPNILRRCHAIFKYVPGEDYPSIKRKRRLEIIGIILVAVIVIVYVYSSVLEKKARLRCSAYAHTHMVNITGSIYMANGNLMAEDGVDYPPTSRWVSGDGSIWGCPCLLKPCINKCCQEGETLQEFGSCRNESNKFKQSDLKVHSVKDSLLDTKAIEIESDHFYVIKGRFSCGSIRKFHLSDDARSSYLMQDGRIFRSDFKKHYRKYTDFCVEPDTNNTHNQYLMCEFPPGNPLRKVKWWHGAGMLVSVPCLLVILMTYCMVPRLFNLHGKEIVCYITSLIIAYTCLGFMKITSYNLSSTSCVLIGHVVQVSLLASFFWLSILCYDIWWAFSGLTPMTGSQGHADKVKFLFYSVYAWGGPLLILVLTLVMEYGTPTPFHSITPIVSENRCFFKDDEARILYLYLPLGVLVFINTTLFIITSLRLKSHTASVNQAGKTCETGAGESSADKNKADKKRFVLFLKLSVVMGLNWILEILSVFLAPGSAFWVITDIANALVGIAMLVLFVCKRRILRVLNHRLFPNVVIVPPVHSNAITSARSITPRAYSVKFRRHSDLGHRPSLANSNDSSSNSVRRMTVTICRSEQNVTN